MTEHRAALTTTSSSSAPAAPGCARRSRRARQGKRTAIICKSLFGKAHTVMAEGGIAAAMGNVNSKDNWQVHFRDTMRGGKFLNNWRMAELHAKEAPDRVWELETYGALFDRTPDGKISQRNFGGHEYPRLAHVGDRTGLELIRTLQQKIVSLQQDDERRARRRRGAAQGLRRVHHHADPAGRRRRGDRLLRLLARATARSSPSRRPPSCSPPAASASPTRSPATRGSTPATATRWRCGPAARSSTWSSSSSTRPAWSGRPACKGILVTESVRGDGGVLHNSEGKRFMFDYVPDVFRGQYAETEDEGDRWYTDPDHNKRPPELLPRDEVARAINYEVKAGRGSPQGGVFLDVSKRLPAEVIRKKLPSMWHQFKELADVDITDEPMEVGPTCHYVMGGVEVEPDTSRHPGGRAVRGR